MAETPSSPDHDPSTPVQDTAGAETDVAAIEGPADLEAVLAAALDEDDLPEPHPPAPTPTLEAATARPAVASYGAPVEEKETTLAAVASYGEPEAEATPAAVASYGSPEVGSVGEPTVATTLEVPPLPTGLTSQVNGEEGGEFDLLIGKVTNWFEQADLSGQWDRLSGPLRGLGLLLGGLLVIKLYVALLDTLDDVPLLPRLLQLVGLIALTNFSVTRLTRSSERKVILEDWKRRWDAFRGS